ncbi:MAG: TonB-dependent hemoglobin/transferrin/lactoferrin family receptor [Pseudomonadota bacterium]
MWRRSFLALLFAQAFVAHAQPADEEKSAALADAVTIIATKTPRELQQTPDAVTVIGQDALEHWGVSTLSEAFAGIPGVDISSGPRPGGESINIRGLSGTRILMSVDGARQNFDGAHRSRLNVDPDLLKTVEILRGPASAIWGSDALGGVLSVTTKDAADFLKPGETFGGRLKSGLEAANGERKLGGTGFARLGDFDLVANFTQRDARNLKQGGGGVLPYSALDSQAGLAKLTRFIGDDREIGVSFQNFFQRGMTPSNPAKEIADDNPLLDRTNNQQYLSGRYAFINPDGLFAGANLTTYRSALAIVEDRVGAVRHDTLDFTTHGGSMQTSLNLPAIFSRITIGGEYFQDSAEATRDGAPRSQFPDAQRQAIGVFVQNEIDVGRLTLIPGLRYDRFDAESNTGAAADTALSRFSPKLGLGYALTDWLTLTTSYGEAFRAPSLLETYAQGTHFLGNEFRPNPDLRPEAARNYELGFRLNFGSLTARLSGFQNDVRDYIETIVVVETTGPFPPALQCAPPSPAVGCVNRNEDGSANLAVPVLVHVGGYTSSENIPRAQIQGLELETNYLIGAFKLGAGYSMLRGENRQTGAPLLTIPADRFNASALWQFGRWQLGARLTHALPQTRVPLDSAGVPVIPATQGYTVTDVFAQWQPSKSLSGLRLNVGMDNLADVNYRRHLDTAAEAGRNLRAGLDYQF